MTLFVDSCVREKSRTRELAEYLLSGIKDEIEIVRLEDQALPLVDEVSVIMRYAANKLKDFSEPLFDLAKQFARADRVVIAAPYWDLSFPALLKRYFEEINITGIVFRYSETGMPVSLCKAKKLYYVTTSGGPVMSDEYGFGYVKMISEKFFGINEFENIKAENLDVWGNDVRKILDQTKKKIDDIISKDFS